MSLYNPDVVRVELCMITPLVLGEEIFTDSILVISLHSPYPLTTFRGLISKSYS